MQCPRRPYAKTCLVLAPSIPASASDTDGHKISKLDRVMFNALASRGIFQYIITTNAQNHVRCLRSLLSLHSSHWHWARDWDLRMIPRVQLKGAYDGTTHTPASVRRIYLMIIKVSSFHDFHALNQVADSFFTSRPPPPCWRICKVYAGCIRA
ncbi:hypothetical protein BJ138DRAFT_1153807 [Hygrophoropsis aurantiaca]|uniref:Uncharacterized protein n=1 Tax=Hygrophoropsis aurantiaca TaxID=72124 RepID=A0ACB8AA33_9AGAM|nr:hypothetical protein BJ138DRAFT_1153807 [Hygrophoropsis aurantiaca]